MILQNTSQNVSKTYKVFLLTILKAFQIKLLIWLRLLNFYCLSFIIPRICFFDDYLSLYYLDTYIITVPHIRYNENLFRKFIFSAVPAVHGSVDCLHSGCLYSSTQYPLPLHTSPHLHPYKFFVIPYRLLD